MSPKQTDREAATIQFDIDHLKDLVTEVTQCCRTGTKDLSTYKRLLRLVRKVIPFDAAALFLNNEIENRFEEVATLDGKVEPLEFLAGPGGSGVAGWAADIGKILYLPDRTRAGGFDPENGYATFLSIPLLTSDRILGVVSFGCREPYALGAETPVCCKYVSELLVMALERLEDRSALESERKEIEELRSGSDRIIGLMNRLEKLEAVAKLAVTTNHDINDLLSVIVGNTQCLLATGTIESQKSLHRVRRIEKVALQISNTNHNLLKIRELLGNSLSNDNSEDCVT